MANYTPQQVEEFLQEFFDVVGTRQYIGARYIPVFGRPGEESIEWDDSAPYEPLTIVLYQGDTYTSMTYVPARVDITDTRYWVRTSNYNAQIEDYRREVQTFDARITANTDGLATETRERIATDSSLDGAINNERDQRIAAIDGLTDTVTQMIEDAADELRDELVPLPVPPQSKYGDDGQILYTDGTGGTRWDQPITPTSEMLSPIIDEWLDEHPEATTTVPDGSISEAKLADGAVTDRKLDKYGVIRMARNLAGPIGVGDSMTPSTVTPQVFMKRSGVTGAASNYNAYCFDVTPGDTYRVGGRYGWDACACLWMDAGDHPIEDSVYPFNTFVQVDDHFEEIVTAPANATKLWVNGYATRACDAFAATLAAVPPSVEYVLEELDPAWVNGKYFHTSNRTSVDAASCRYCSIAVAPGETYVVQTSSNYLGKAWAIYDINNNLIDYYREDDTFANDTIVMPNGAYELVVNALITSTNHIIEFSRILRLEKSSVRSTLAHRRAKWCAIGDSITDANTLVVNNYRMPNYVNFVGDSLGLDAVNRGIGGTGYLASNNGANTTFAQRALTIDADTDIVTVFGTLNDCYLPDLAIGSATDAPGSSTVYGQVKQTLLNVWSVCPAATVIIVTPCPFPAGNEVDTGASLYQVTKDYVAAISEVASMYSVPLLDLFHESNVRPWDQAFRSVNYLNGDGQHLNSNAHLRYVAPKFEAAIVAACGR